MTGNPRTLLFVKTYKHPTPLASHASPLNCAHSLAWHLPLPSFWLPPSLSTGSRAREAHCEHAWLVLASGLVTKAAALGTVSVLSVMLGLFPDCQM